MYAQSPKKQSAVRVAIIFFVFVVLLLLCSFILRIGSTISQSTFDGTGRYTLVMPLVSQKVDVISFAPGQERIDIGTKFYTNDQSHNPT